MDRLGSITVGNPAHEGVRMGPVATAGQLKDVRAGADQLARDGRLVFGNADLKPVGAPEGKGFFTSPILVEVEPGAPAETVHSREVFGPVATVVPYSGDAGGRGGDRRPRPRRPGLLRLLRGHRLHRRPRARHRAVPRPRLPRQREDRRGLARARAPSCRCWSTAAPGARAGARSSGGVRGLALYMQRVALEGSRPVIEKIVR